MGLSRRPGAQGRGLRTPLTIDLCQSEFERTIFTALIERGYRVTPQVGSVGFAIDMVVEGEGGRRLAIECDGDQYHGPERWADDMRRQRILERVGWTLQHFRPQKEWILAPKLSTLIPNGISQCKRKPDYFFEL